MKGAALAVLVLTLALLHMTQSKSLFDSLPTWKKDEVLSKDVLTPNTTQMDNQSTNNHQIRSYPSRPPTVNHNNPNQGGSSTLIVVTLIAVCVFVIIAFLVFFG